MAQAVEVHVRTAVDAGQYLAAQSLALDILLHAGHAERPGRFDDRAILVEYILDGGAYLVGIHQNDLVHIFTHQIEGVFTDLFHRYTVGKDADLRQHHALAGLDRIVHGCRIIRLHTDDLRVGRIVLQIHRHAGDQAAAADGHEHRIHIVFHLPQQLFGDRSLSGNDLRIVVGMHEMHAGFLAQPGGMGRGIGIGVAEQHDCSTQSFHSTDLDVRRGGGHHDGRLATAMRGTHRHTLRMIAGRGADDTTGALRIAHLCDLVIRTAQFEREYRLHVLAFEQNFIVQPGGQARSKLQRGFAGDVVNAGVFDGGKIGFCLVQVCLIQFGHANL